MRSPRRCLSFEAGPRAAHCNLVVHCSPVGRHTAAAGVEVAVIAAAVAPEARLDPPTDSSLAGLETGGLATLAGSSSGSTCWS